MVIDSDESGRAGRMLGGTEGTGGPERRGFSGRVGVLRVSDPAAGSGRVTAGFGAGREGSLAGFAGWLDAGRLALDDAAFDVGALEPGAD